jgi:trans,polycis-decaprenyl diphosphate synthase
MRCRPTGDSSRPLRIRRPSPSCLPRSWKIRNPQGSQQAADGKINPGRISEATFAKHLHRSDIPDVDLFIRTSGEQRASNFLLWQAAYAEFVFQDKLWPDYDRRDLWEACEEYVHRNRRFGRAE